MKTKRARMFVFALALLVVPLIPLMAFGFFLGQGQIVLWVAQFGGVVSATLLLVLAVIKILGDIATWALKGEQ